jgi:hypothetical protein
MRVGITGAELAQHSTPADAWISIDGDVYDITAFGKAHPGGDVLFSYAGWFLFPSSLARQAASSTDGRLRESREERKNTHCMLAPCERAVLYPPGQNASDVFIAFHEGSKARLMLKPLLVGKLAAKESASGLEADFRALRTQLRAEGYMEVDTAFYSHKMLELGFLLAAAIYLLWGGRAAVSTAAWLAAVLFLSAFNLQSCWATHDFLHNQVRRATHTQAYTH